MNESPTVSVIVPIYNAEKYLSDCLDSIVNQTYKNIEVVLVDDGSSDRSGEICDEYAKKYTCVKVLHKANGGVTAARRDGVRIARGSWVTFIDADDTIPLNSINRMCLATSAQIDVVLGAWNKFYLHEKHRLIPLGVRGFLDSESYIKGFLRSRIYSGPVGKLFRSNLLLDEVFDIPSDITHNEDLIMNLRIARKVRGVYVNPAMVVYNYHERQNSVSHRKVSVALWDKIFKVLLESVDSRHNKEVYSYIANILYRNKKELDVSQSNFFDSIKGKPLTCEGRFYFLGICNNSLFINSFIYCDYIYNLVLKCLNTLIGKIFYKS